MSANEDTVRRVRRIHARPSHYDWTPGGQKLDTIETLTFTIKNGKVTRIVSSFGNPEDEKAEDAFSGMA